MFAVFCLTVTSLFSLNSVPDSGITEDSSLTILQKNLSLAEEEGNPYLQAETQLQLAEYLIGFGLYELASENLANAQDLFLELNSEAGLAASKNLLGQLYYQSGSVPKALEQHQDAIQIFRQTKNVEALIHSYGLLGSMYEKSGNYKGALENQRTALGLLGFSRESELRAEILENIGSIHEDLEHYDSAKWYFLLALNNSGTELSENRKISILNNLGDAYFKSGALDSGKYFTEKAVLQSQQLGNFEELRSSLEDLAEIEFALGNTERAYRILEQSSELGEELFSNQAANNLAVLESQFESIIQNQRIKQLENLRTKDLWLKSLFLSLAVLALILGWLIYNRQKLKIQNSQRILEQKESMIELTETLAEKEKENRRLVELRLDQEEKAFARSKSAQALHMIEKNRLLETILQKLDRLLQAEARDQRKGIRNLMKEIDFKFSKDSDWHELEENLDHLNSGFFRELKERGIQLTQSETKLANLMLMDLSSKEIASNMGITPASLRISRYRLRKKLRLEKQESLRQFLLRA